MKRFQETTLSSQFSWSNTADKMTEKKNHKRVIDAKQYRSIYLGTTNIEGSKNVEF